MSGHTHSRRAFVSSVGALSALGLARGSLLASREASHPNQAAPGRPARPRGLAPRPDDFLLAPGLVYLQTGSLGPTPRPVFDRTIAAWKELEQNPVHYGFGPHERAMEDARATIAAFVGCKTPDLVITRSTTEGMNWVAQGLALRAGDRVLTTDQEHPGGRVCWDYLVRKDGVALDVVTIAPGDHDPQAIVERFARALTPRTRVLSFSHVLTSTGLRMPAAELSALARSRGCVAVVDGAQAPGGIAVNVKALGCHVYASSGHKWMLGPKGTGFLYLSEDLGQAVDPLVLQSGRAAYSASSGVTNIPGVLGFAAAIEYTRAIGIEAVERHNLALRDRLYEALKSVPAVRVVSAPPGPLASPMLTYALPGTVKSAELYQRLSDRHRVVVKVVPTNWLNGHRISTHLFNAPDDVDALVSALKAELS